MNMRIAAHNKGMHPTADTKDFMFNQRAGRRVMPSVRRPAFSRCGREWLGLGGCVAGWIVARQAHEVDFSGCSRKNDGHELKTRQV
jgi:hypothetical protein